MVSQISPVRVPGDAVAWFRLGVARHGLGQHATALAAYGQAQPVNLTLHLATRQF